MKPSNRVIPVIVAAGLAGAGLALGGCASARTASAGVAVTQPQTPPQPPEPAAPPAPAAAQPGAGMGMQLVAGLKATEGCLGATAVQATDGRLAVIAWFENKAGAKRWYESRTHQRLMQGMAAGEPAAEPMAHIADDTPIMVIAAITPAEPGKTYGLGIPVAQISIELFQPLPGGAAVNGRFSPEAFPVEHMRKMTALPREP